MQAVVLPHDLNFYPPHLWLMEILLSGGPELKSGPASLEETHTGESLQWFIQSRKKGIGNHLENVPASLN